MFGRSRRSRFSSTRRRRGGETSLANTILAVLRQILGEAVDDFVQVDFAPGRLVGSHDGVARGVDAEISAAPRIDAVEIERVLDLPRSGIAWLGCCAVHSVLLGVGCEKEARTIAEAARA